MAATVFPERELAFPPLRILVQFRQSAGDAGPAIRIYAPVEGEERQVLRIDCFEENPHYHLDPMDRDRVVLLHLKGYDACLQWLLNHLREHLKDLLQEAGYPEVAEQINETALREWLPQLEEAYREVVKEGTRPV